MARGLRIVIVGLVAVVVVWLLFTVVFPRVESYMENPSIET